MTSDYELAVAASNPLSELESWPTASSLNAYAIATFKKNVSAIAKVQAGAMVAGSVSGYPSVTLTIPVASTAGTLLVASFVTPADQANFASGVWDTYQMGDNSGVVGTSGWLVLTGVNNRLSSPFRPYGGAAGSVSKWSALPAQAAG